MPLSVIMERGIFLWNFSSAKCVNTTKGEKTMSTIKHFTLILTLAILTACSTAPIATPTPLSPLESNHQKWEAQSINHYRFNVSLICFCAFRDKMPLSIEVKDGQVVSMLDNQGQPITQFVEEFEKYNTIEKLFNIVEQTSNGGADKVTIEYNAEHGYPQSIDIDYIEEAIDDELLLEVSEFEILN